MPVAALKDPWDAVFDSSEPEQTDPWADILGEPEKKPAAPMRLGMVSAPSQPAKGGLSLTAAVDPRTATQKFSDVMIGSPLRAQEAKTWAATPTKVKGSLVEQIVGLTENAIKDLAQFTDFPIEATKVLLGDDGDAKMELARGLVEFMPQQAFHLLNAAGTIPAPLAVDLYDKTSGPPAGYKQSQWNNLTIMQKYGVLKNVSQKHVVEHPLGTTLGALGVGKGLMKLKPKAAEVKAVESTTGPSGEAQAVTRGQLTAEPAIRQLPSKGELTVLQDKFAAESFDQQARKAPIPPEEVAANIERQAPGKAEGPAPMELGALGVTPKTVKATLKTLKKPVEAIAEKFDKSPTQRAAEERYLDQVGWRDKNIYRAGQKSEKWTKELSEAKREDIGAAVEGIDNLRTGKTPVLNETQMRVMREYKEAQETARKSVNEYLKEVGDQEYIKALEDYLPHIYTGKSVKKFMASKWRTSSPNAKQRKLPTLADAQEYGLEPLTQDIAYLHKRWADVNFSVAHNRKVAKEIKAARLPDGTKAAVTGEQPPNIEGRKWVRWSHPALQKAFGTRNQAGDLVLHKGDVWIHPDYARVARMAFENPIEGRTWRGRTFDQLNAVAKTSELVLSGFHFIALGESSQAVLATIKNPLRGIFLVGKEAKAATGKPLAMTFRAGKAIQKNRPEIALDAVEHGLQISKTSTDVAYSTMSKMLRQAEKALENVPGGGPVMRGIRKGYEGVQAALWNQFHTGSKLYAYHTIVADMLPRLPKTATPRDIKLLKREVVSILNDAFGGQQWESKFWLRPKNLQMARRVLLAPDWTLSNLSIAADAFKGIKNPVHRKLVWKYWRNMALSVVGTIQAINMATVGKPTWENEKGHELDIDVTPIMKKLGLLDEDSKERRYVRLAKQAREVMSWVQHPVKIFGHKLSPMASELFKQFADHQFGSDYPADWTRKEYDETVEKLGARVKSFLTKFRPFSLGGNQFAFSLPMSKGMTNYKAIRAYTEALDAQDWKSLLTGGAAGKRVTQAEVIKQITEAAELNGLETQDLLRVAVSNVRSKYYAAFWDALQDEDIDDANEAAKRLHDLDGMLSNLKRSLSGRGATPEQIKEAEKAWDQTKSSDQRQRLGVLSDVDWIIGKYREARIAAYDAYLAGDKQKAKEIRAQYKKQFPAGPNIILTPKAVGQYRKRKKAGELDEPTRQEKKVQRKLTRLKVGTE